MGGVVTVDMAALGPGAYTLVAVARNAPTAPFTDPSEASSAVYAFEARAKAPTPNPPAWRATVLILSDGSVRIEQIVPVVEPAQIVWLQRDGTLSIMRGTN
jgi:hypothetical protein